MHPVECSGMRLLLSGAVLREQAGHRRRRRCDDRIRPERLRNTHSFRGRQARKAATLASIPTGVPSRPAFMITKDPHSHGTKTLRQEQSLRDHADTAEVLYVLNPKYPDLIPRPQA